MRLERIQPFTVQVAANAQGPIADTRLETVRDQQVTLVAGIPDIKIMDVKRRDPVIDVGDTTAFEIHIKNIGSKEATGVHVDFLTSQLLQVVKTDPATARTNPNNPQQHGFEPIDRLAPDASQTFVVWVKALKSGVADFNVEVFWDGLSDTAIRNGNIVRITEGPIARSADAQSPR